MKHFFCIYQARKDGKAVSLRCKLLFYTKPYSLSLEEFKPSVCVHKQAWKDFFVISLSAVINKTLEKLENETLRLFVSVWSVLSVFVSSL